MGFGFARGDQGPGSVAQAFVAVEIVRRERLLDPIDLGFLEFIRHLNGVRFVPLDVRSHVHHKGDVVTTAWRYRADQIEIAFLV